MAQGTLFNYQGRLNDNGQPANGTYDLTFTLYDSTNLPGNTIGSPVTNLSVSVAGGIFSVNLDFGPAFDGAERWLQIGVRTNGAANFSTLSPRQPLTPVPYAIFAGVATNLVGPLSPANLVPVASQLSTVSNGLYSTFNASLSTNLASLSNSGIITTNDYAKLNSYPNGFGVMSPLPPVVMNTWWANWQGAANTTNAMKYFSTNGILDLAKKYHTPFYYVLDDFWMDRTNIPNGILQPDPKLWPSGMKVIADQAHALGIQFGIYPQSAGWGISPANFYGNGTNLLAWGVDYLKFELGYPGGPLGDVYALSSLLHPFWTNGHPVFIESACAIWSPLFTGMVQSPRCIVLGDVYSYENLMARADLTRTFTPVTIGPGRGFFPSVDYVNFNLTQDQRRAHWTIEAMIPAAWGFSFWTNNINIVMPDLTNEDVFSINQDPLVSPGFLATSNNYVNVYERRCVSNTFAISIENRNRYATNYTLWFTNLPGVPSTCVIRDCWAHTNYLATDSFTIQVNPTSAALLRFTPAGATVTNILAVNWPGSMVVSTVVNGVQTISYAPLDLITSNYIARAGLTNNPSEMLMAAVVVSLGKQHGWWNNWDALYLFRGSTSNSTAQNLISTNYTISWQTNGMSFDWTGVTGDGISSYGDTHFNPVTAIAPHYTTQSGSFFILNRTPAPAGANGFIGASLSLKAGLYCDSNTHSLGFFGLNTSSTLDDVNVLIEPDSGDFSGYILANRSAANAQTIFHDQFTGNFLDGTAATGVPNASFYILGVNNDGGLSYPCSCNLSLAGFGAGMTASQWLVFENDMKTAMSILGL
ncbi:MAG TPA: hypothetical protein VHC44_18145 [Verrucomicrobiae bacterium]|nr:hypothetical protein [Verrucomicrobiae bacterium]